MEKAQLLEKIIPLAKETRQKCLDSEKLNNAREKGWFNFLKKTTTRSL